MYWAAEQVGQYDVDVIGVSAHVVGDGGHAVGGVGVHTNGDSGGISRLGCQHDYACGSPYSNSGSLCAGNKAEIGVGSEVGGRSERGRQGTRILRNVIARYVAAVRVILEGEYSECATGSGQVDGGAAHRDFQAVGGHSSGPGSAVAGVGVQVSCGAVGNLCPVEHREGARLAGYGRRGTGRRYASRTTKYRSRSSGSCTTGIDYPIYLKLSSHAIAFDANTHIAGQLEEGAKILKRRVHGWCRGTCGARKLGSDRRTGHAGTGNEQLQRV